MKKYLFSFINCVCSLSYLCALLLLSDSSQDDYLDCYGSPEVIGKIGTDIQDNKCSWLVVQALDRATPKQRKVLEDHYGKHDEASVKKVKQLFAEMDLEALFLKYEEESYARIQALLSAAQDLPTEVFEFLLRKIYKRSK